MSRSPQGLRAWLLQRLSGVYLGVFLLYGSARWLLAPPLGWEDWHAWLTHPLMRVAGAGFVLAVLIHAWTGMRNVVLDYLHTLGIRLAVLTLIGLILAASGLRALQVLVTA